MRDIIGDIVAIAIVGLLILYFRLVDQLEFRRILVILGWIAFFALVIAGVFGALLAAVPVS